ncbi:MAG: sigma-70 family RNA polymerase sigma factor, partial [Acetatifactor sp.]|nr:sigma-70 family RNA polymerase sigma factor [Acetatifactor sp.]
MNKEDLIGYADDLLRTAMYKLDGTDAEDLVQETMLAALLAIEQGREIENPGAWLQGVLNRKYYDFLRQKYRRPTVSIDMLGEGQYQKQLQQEDEALRRLERSQEAEALRRELAHQAGIYREVLVRYYMHGESVGHIARALQIPENTVKSRLYAGREHIRKDFAMEKYTKQSYEPETLSIGMSGRYGINGEPSNLGLQDKIKMNLMILAYDKPVTLRELSEGIGIAIAYIEPIVEQLVDGELMKRIGDKVYTDFII